MAVTFPTSPTNGQTFTANGLSYVYNATYGVWRLNVSAGGSSGGGVTTYATVAELPLTNNTNGDMAFVEETDRLYLSNDNGWFNIALINTSPTITSGGAGSYVLATDGTPTVITLVANDPEEVPLTWSYTVTSGALGTTATVSQADNVFTITPGTTDPDDAGTFEITFSVTDGTNIVNDVNSFSLNFITVIENSRYTTALITTDGTTGDNSSFTDSSPNALTITTAGTPSSQSFSPYRSGGYSTYHPGTNSDGFKFTTITAPESGNFTYECWIYATGASDDPIIETRDVNNNAGGFTLTALDTSSIRIWDTQARVTATGLDYINKWTHIAVVKNGSTTTLYINGTSEGTTTAFGTHSDDDLYVGYSPHYSQGFTGYISDLRYTTTAVYTSNFTPPIERLESITDTQVLTSVLPYIADGSSNNHSITVNGNTHTRPFTPYDYAVYDSATHGGSVYFDGNDYLQCANDFSTFFDNPWTIEFWAYLNSLSTSNAISIGDGGGVDGMYLLHGGNGFYLGSNGSWNISAYTSSTITTGRWHHCAVTWDGSYYKIFVDGVLENTSTSSAKLGPGPYTMAIGAGYTGTQPTNGYLSDIKMTTSAVYTSEFTPPTEPLSSTNATLHVKGIGAPIIDKSQSTRLTLGGDATVSNAQYKYSTSSIAFDGTGDYLEIPYSDEIMRWWDTDYTMEYWIRANAFGQTGEGKTNFMTHGTLNSTTDYWSMGPTNSGGIKWFWWSGAPNEFYTSTAITLNTWHHLAFVYDKSTTTAKIYIDGTLEASTTVSTTPQVSSSYPLYIGHGSNTAFNGYIEDFRITKGLARYTANFTPPTGSLEG